jgi:hypothetical protein
MVQAGGALSCGSGRDECLAVGLLAVRLRDALRTPLSPSPRAELRGLLERDAELSSVEQAGDIGSPHAVR